MDISSESARRHANPERVGAFTDGVFAIIITILVLELDVPSGLDERSLTDAFDEMRPTLIAWVISFLITGMYWVWHRDLFTQVRYVNRDVVWLNLLFLLPASLIPFAASILGNYHDEAIALHAYGVVLTAVSLMRMALYWYVTGRPSLLYEPKSKRNRQLGMYLAAAPIAVYVVAMIIADSLPGLSLVLYFAMPLLYFVLITFLRANPETTETADEFG